MVTSRFRFDCLFYYVSDLDRAVRFYVDNFGFQLVSRDAVARFRVDGVLFELVPTADPAVLSGGGNARLTLTVEEMGQARAALTINGVPVSEVRQVADGLVASCRDPDGNEIVLWQYVQDALDEVPMKVAIRGMAPLIQVFDMPRSVAFYRDVLGFEVVETSPARGPDDFDWGLLRRQGAELMLNTAYEHDSRPAEPEGPRFGGHRDTTLFFGCPNLDAAYEALRTKGIPVAPPAPTRYGMRQLRFSDPDGYGICLQWRVA